MNGSKIRVWYMIPMNTPLEQALDALTESGQIVSKEFGKAKIYIPSQSNLSVMSKEARLFRD